MALHPRASLVAMPWTGVSDASPLDRCRIHNAPWERGGTCLPRVWKPRGGEWRALAQPPFSCEDWPHVSELSCLRVSQALSSPCSCPGYRCQWGWESSHHHHSHRGQSPPHTSQASICLTPAAVLVEPGWWHRPVIPAPGEAEAEGSASKSSLGHLAI